MSSPTRKIELLAPARDLSCGMAAIDCGADAVYIGAPRFGAREDAGNPVKDIAALVEYAHIYWSKVYVTLNTLLYDHEIDAAVKLIHQLYDIGIDGLIIQDTGLLECDLPPLPLIASTQMHNDRADKIAFLQAVGFRRAILARELSLTEIVEIRRQVADIELECFIHGALCVSYSGQCYMSYALGGRSGNRGQCAQPCRKRYRLLDANGNIISDWQHLLSLRDLNLSQYLEQLLDAGVTAFKIEGRLKDRFYVMNTVGYYRRLLDELLSARGWQKSSSGSVLFDFIPDPQKTFHRGHSNYFLHGRHRQLAAMDSPKHVGEWIGRIAHVGKGYVVLHEGALPLHNGDGISFFTADKQLTGTQVNRVNGNKIYPDKMVGLNVGTDLYRNYDHHFITKLRKSRTHRIIGIAMELQEKNDKLLLHVTDEDGVRVFSSLACKMSVAEKPEIARQRIESQLRKTGGTPFVCHKVTVNLHPMKMVALTDLNALRRDALEKLSQARQEQHPLLRFPLQPNEVPYPQKRLNFTGNVLNQKARAFYHRHGVEEIEPAAESGLDMHNRVLMTTKYCLRYQLGFCDGKGRKSGPPEPYFLVDEQNRRFLLAFDCNECRMIVKLDL